MTLATQIVDSLTSEWDPERYRDTFTDELKAIIERKDKGKDVVVEPEAKEEGGKVLDLMAALEESVSAAKQRRTKKAAPRKRAAPKKAAARRKSA